MRRNVTTRMRALFLFLAIIAVASFSACGGSKSEQESASRTLDRSINVAPETFDLHRANSVEAGTLLRDMGEGLTAYTADGRLIPGAATHWDVSSDGDSYTFYLRPHALWSNGDPVRAEDFQAALRRLVMPSTAAPFAKFLTVVKNANAIVAGKKQPDELGVEVVDDHTLRIELETPAPYFLQLLTHPSTFPIHVPSLQRFGDQFSRVGNLVTNGAYRLVEDNVGASAVLERNEFYWNNDATYFDKVIYHILAPETEIMRFRAGDLDITANVAEDAFAKMREDYSDELKVSPALGVYYYGINFTRPWLRDNPKLRKALSMAIDRDVLATKIKGRGEVPAYGLVPPGIDNYTPQPLSYKDWPLEQRLAEAQRLYKEAGYSLENPLEIELRYNIKGGHEKVAVAIQAMWRDALGFEAQLVAEEFKVMLANIREMKITEVFRLSWSGDYNDAYAFLQLVESDNPQNLTGYANPRVDDLLRKAANEVDLAVRRGYLEEVERISLEDHPVLPLYFYVTKHMVARDIEGWAPMPLDYHYSKYLHRSDDGDE